MAAEEERERERESGRLAVARAQTPPRDCCSWILRAFMGLHVNKALLKRVLRSIMDLSTMDQRVLVNEPFIARSRCNAS